jgi:hypothetical protein
MLVRQIHRFGTVEELRHGLLQTLSSEAAIAHIPSYLMDAYAQQFFASLGDLRDEKVMLGLLEAGWATHLRHDLSEKQVRQKDSCDIYLFDDGSFLKREKIRCYQRADRSTIYVRESDMAVTRKFCIELLDTWLPWNRPEVAFAELLKKLYGDSK